MATVTKETALATLVTKFGKEDWFHSAEVEPVYGHDLVLYAKTMSPKILKAAPAKVDKFNVLLHFAAYKEAALDKFANKPIVTAVETIPEEASEEEDVSGELITQLWALKKICGKESLSHIFYEIHDGNDAVTDDSKEFPEVRKQLQTLYDDLGFDILFEEIEK